MNKGIAGSWWQKASLAVGIFILAMALMTPVWADKENPTINEMMAAGELREFGMGPEDVPRPDTVEAGYPTDEPEGDAASVQTVAGGDAVPAPTPAGKPTAVTAKPAVAPAGLDLSQKVVMIGRPPYVSLKEMMAHVQSLTAFLKKELGAKDVRIVTSKSYAVVLNALDRGTIDFAWLGPTSYIIGTQKNSLIPLAQAKRRTGSTYHGLFITRKESPIQKLDDIKGKVIGFVDPQSASGYLYPLYQLKLANINPHKDCKKVEFLQGHDAILRAVLDKKIDVGVCLEDTIETLKDKKIADQVRVVAKTADIPSDIVACRAACPPELRDRLTAALLKTATLNEANAGAGGTPITEFMPPNLADIDTVRIVLRAVESVRQR